MGLGNECRCDRTWLGYGHRDRHPIRPYRNTTLRSGSLYCRAGVGTQLRVFQYGSSLSRILEHHREGRSENILPKRQLHRELVNYSATISGSSIQGVEMVVGILMNQLGAEITSWFGRQKVVSTVSFPNVSELHLREERKVGIDFASSLKSNGMKRA